MGFPRKSVVLTNSKAKQPISFSVEIKRCWSILWLSCFLLGFSVVASGFEELTPEQLEQWFEDDERDHPYDLDNNEGELELLQQPPAKPTLHSNNILTIEPHSLDSGWVTIEQCHQHLDPIDKVEVVYRYKQMRKLRITNTSRIGKARVEGQSIQLEQVNKDAGLCIQAEAKILYRQDDGRYFLRNGPFQRRFLDSFFPMRVTLTIHYPGELIKLQNIKPQSGNGFVVKAGQGLINIDSWFAGKLVIEIEFGEVS